MRPKTNRLLMLLVGAAISGCASQTDRSSSGGGAQAQTEAVAPQPAPTQVYEPTIEAVQIVDHPLEETAPPKPAPVAAAPKDEATPDFPITKYELPEDEEIEDLGPQEDESASAEEEATPEEESSVGETTEYAEEEYAEEEVDEELEALGPQTDDSGTASYPEEKLAAEDSVVGEPKVYPNEPAAPKAEPAAPKAEPATPKAVPATPKAAPAAPKTISVNFETEPLFSFDKSAIRADQKTKLDELISSLGSAEIESISVVGHTDRIGTKAYNQKLSERRAEAVRNYLVSKGIPADKIRSEGRGKSEPVTGDACNKDRGKKLISCLQPDRRVDVSVSASKRVN